MKISCATVAFLFPLFFAWPAAAATPDVREAMPATITLAGAQAPAWVDASIAVTSVGTVNGELLPEHGAGVAAMLALPQTNGCASVGPIIQDRPFTRQRGSFEDLITHSRAVVLARVSVDSAMAPIDASDLVGNGVGATSEELRTDIDQASRWAVVRECCARCSTGSTQRF